MNASIVQITWRLIGIFFEIKFAETDKLYAITFFKEEMSTNFRERGIFYFSASHKVCAHLLRETFPQIFFLGKSNSLSRPSVTNLL